MKIGIPQKMVKIYIVHMYVYCRVMCIIVLLHVTVHVL